MSLSRTFLDVRPLPPVFRRLLFGRTVSTLGTFMTMVTVMFQVWDMTHSTIWSGAVGVAQAVPMVEVSLFAGGLMCVAAVGYVGASTPELRAVPVKGEA